MLDQLRSFIQQKKLFNKKDRILLAISGGIDSMVMADLFLKANYSIGIAHCNFQLRGAASDKDEALVADFAQKNNLPFYRIQFDTLAAAQHYKLSIQEVARDLRYQWLADICHTHHFQYIATAHHLNDSLETVLYNLSKGCGIRGLHGIPLQSNKVIRPMLFAHKAIIEKYAEKEAIEYREDASNATTKYARNLIRHELIPVLQQINPTLLDTFARTVQQIQETEYLFKEAIQQYHKQLVEPQVNYSIIHIALIANHPAQKTILYELLSPFDFNASQINQFLSVNTQIGAITTSTTHELLKDRNQWLLRPKQKKELVHQSIAKNTKEIVIANQTFTFRIQLMDTISFPQPNYIAVLDLAKLTFPLLLRNWQIGDRFQPFGMKGQHKKIQDFLSDLKLNRFKKESVLVLESGGQIAWVVGYRTSELFRVMTDTEKVLVVEWVAAKGRK